MVFVGPRPLPVSGRFVALFGSHAAAWLGHAAALKRFLGFRLGNLTMGARG